MFRTIALLFFVIATIARAAEYEVGPGKACRAIADVPWNALAPGDRVSIFWRAEPYREKWVICREGTREQPIVVRGIANAKGELPVIDGNGAVTAKGLDYWGEQRSVIKIGGASNPKDTMPAFISIENLDVRGARPPFAFTGRKGLAKYAAEASAIWIEKGAHVTVRGCVLHDCANGFFVSSGSREVLMEHCLIFDNGMERSIYQHNIYTEANGITFQYNRLGPLRAACFGNNLKDRSAGLVVRYNWIEGGNRELDLVDSDHADIRAEPAYRRAFVYGNVIIEPPEDGNNQIVHYGGDSGKAAFYRNGTLYFFNNTVVSRRNDNTVLFRLATNDEHVDCRNNILFVTAPGRNLAMLDAAGQLGMFNNWMKPGWVQSHGKLTGRVTANGSIEGDNPGFTNAAQNDFHLTPTSPSRKAAAPLPPEALPEHNLAREYPDQPRVDEKATRCDLGAFSFRENR